MFDIIHTYVHACINTHVWKRIWKDICQGSKTGMSGWIAYRYSLFPSFSVSPYLLILGVVKCTAFVIKEKTIKAIFKGNK